MLSKYVVTFSGWFEVNTAVTKFMDIDTGVVKTGDEWIADGVNLGALVLDKFEDASNEALDGEFAELDISKE